jgi:hypothetical protein
VCGVARTLGDTVQAVPSVAYHTLTHPLLCCLHLMNETTRLEAEIMRRVIIREGMESVTEIMHLDSKTKGRAIAPEGVEKESKGK